MTWNRGRHEGNEEGNEEGTEDEDAKRRKEKEVKERAEKEARQKEAKERAKERAAEQHKKELEKKGQGRFRRRYYQGRNLSSSPQNPEVNAEDPSSGAEDELHPATSRRDNFTSSH